MHERRAQSRGLPIRGVDFRVLDMDVFVNFLADLFTRVPEIYLSWPATAMIVGWGLLACSPTTGAALAITPRSARGLVGIITAPFIHANGAHVLANLPPFLVLGWLVLVRDPNQFLTMALLIAAVQGVLLWLFGRKAAHVGMSGVIFGFLGWLCGLAWFTRATMDLVVAGCVLIFYGGMLAGVAPVRKGTSWEGHLFGLLAGFGLAWYLSLSWVTKHFLFRSLSLQ
jgi:membrane associated rhomboid family serine protease